MVSDQLHLGLWNRQKMRNKVGDIFEFSRMERTRVARHITFHFLVSRSMELSPEFALTSVSFMLSSVNPCGSVRNTHPGVQYVLVSNLV